MQTIFYPLNSVLRYQEITVLKSVIHVEIMSYKVNNVLVTDVTQLKSAYGARL